MKIDDIVRKLIAHEKSAREVGSIAEAEAFAERIQQLITKHKLETKDFSESGAFGFQNVVRKGKTVSSWRAVLAKSIAKHFFCQSFAYQGQDAILFVGREAERIAAIEVFEYLSSVARALASREYKETNSQYTKTVFETQFCLGFAYAIYLRMEQSARNLLKGDVNNRALIRCNAELDTYVSNLHLIPTEAQRRGRFIKDENVFKKGFAKGVVAPLSTRPGLQAEGKEA